MPTLRMARPIRVANIHLVQAGVGIRGAAPCAPRTWACGGTIPVPMTTAQPIATPSSPEPTPDGGAAPGDTKPEHAADPAGTARPERESLIRARGLTKKFGEFVAVDAIDFDVAPGESFGFLGPNGAGKTSTMRMIGCVSPITSGELTVLGMNPAHDGARIKARLGVVPQQDTLDMELTVRENLIIYGRYFDLSRREAGRRADNLLEFVQLTDRAKSTVESLSGGMKRRLTIARSLVNEPDLLLLDEPTTGLDPQARHLLWDRLYRLKQQGVTLVLTTHYMDEAEQLCDRLVVMDKAHIVAEGSPRELIDRYSTKEVLELRFPVGVLETLDTELDGLADRIERLPDRVLLYADDGEAAAEAAHARGLRPETVLVRRSSLEDVFLRLTGRTLIE
jgi:lipooligosaccharide transport system ATP-binding protein